MGEILPDGSLQSHYEGYCPQCGKIIKMNMQGNPDNHKCEPKSKTAIRQLIERLSYLQNTNGSKISIETVIEYAKELESVNEQQIIDAVNVRHPMQRVGLAGEEYFNETYEKP